MSRLYTLREVLRDALEGTPEERGTLHLTPDIAVAFKSLFYSFLWEQVGLDYVETHPQEREGHPFVDLTDIFNWLYSENIPIENYVGQVLMCRAYTEAEADAIVARLHRDKLDLVKPK